MAKILFLSHRVPYPPNKGEKIRAYNCLCHLSRHHDVFLGALTDETPDPLSESPFVHACREARSFRVNRLESSVHIGMAALSGEAMSVAAFANKDLANWVDQTLIRERPDLVYAFSSAMAQFATSSAARNVPLIIDFVDVDSEKFRQYAADRKGAARYLYSVEARRLLRFDQSVAQRAAASIFVSEAERALFESLYPQAAGKLFAVPNGIDCEYFDPAPRARRTPPAQPVIVFMGRMDYYPNIEAVTWFAREILPTIRTAFADVRFQIVGAAPTSQVTALAREPNIEVTGAVPDIRPYYLDATLAVAPLQIGRGIQNKVLEAMAMALPVVATPAALEGVEAKPGEHLLVADDAPAFASAVIEILSGRAPAQLGERARTQMLKEHVWATHLAKLDRIIEGAVKQGRD